VFLRIIGEPYNDQLMQCAQNYFSRNHHYKKMNGAELPCGTALKVEPSDPLYKLRKKGKRPENWYEPASAQEEYDDPAKAKDEPKPSEPKAPEASKAKDDDDDDLDDFFASLT
jgi:hypothetical protein